MTCDSGNPGSGMGQAQKCVLVYKQPYCYKL